MGLEFGAWLSAGGVSSADLTQIASSAETPGSDTHYLPNQELTGVQASGAGRRFRILTAARGTASAPGGATPVVIVAGASPGTIDLAARVADYWFIDGTPLWRASELASRAKALAVGRYARSLKRRRSLKIAVNDLGGDRPLDEHSAQELLARLRAFESAGIDAVFAKVESGASIELFARQVLHPYRRSQTDLRAQSAFVAGIALT